MPSLSLLKYAHELCAFFYVGAILAAHWNVLAVRRTSDWSERAALLELNQRLSVMFSLLPLIAAGMIGSVMAPQLGYRMAETRALQLATGLWLVLVLLGGAIEIPTAARLAALARSAAKGAGQEPVGWNGLLGRMRLGNALQLAVFLALLWIMVAPWKV